MWLLLLFDIILRKPLYCLLKSIKHTMYAFLNGQTRKRVRNTSRVKNMLTFKIDDAEIRKIWGLFLINGYHNLPSEENYWNITEAVKASTFIYKNYGERSFLCCKIMLA